MSEFLGGDGLATLASEDSQIDNSENGGAGKKPAWSKPSNGATSEFGAIMGAESWPALSESARASPKSPSTYSLKALPHAVSQEMGLVSLSSPKEVSASISAPNSTPNQAVPSRQRLKRGGGGGGGGGSSNHNSTPTPTNDSLSQEHGSVDSSPPNAGKSGGSIGASNTNKDSGQRGGTHGGNESHPQRNSFRRSNSGPLTHGRRDHERGKQDWGNRSFGRESNGPQQRAGSRPFVRGPAPSTPFMSPPPPSVTVRPFVGPVVYTEMPSPVFYVPGPHPDPLRSMSMVPIQSMFFPMHDPHLPLKIVNQIDYYFSNENLVKDTFLRQNMDAEGWVPIKLIAGFKKVVQLTDNIQLILDTIKVSNVVEVQGDKVRRKNDWMKWIMPSIQTIVTSPQAINRNSPNMLAVHFNNVALDEKAAT